MTIHATAIIVHGCKIHLEPTGPKQSDAEQRLQHEINMASSADNCLRGILSGMTAIAKPPRKCQHCSGTIEGGGFVIVGGGVMHHECFREAMTSAKKPADRITELQHELAREKDATEAERLRASLKAMAEQSATYMRERDEARQMHRERVFWEKATLNEQIATLGDRLTRLRVAAQAVCDSKPGQYIGDQIDELRKAMG